MRISFLLILLCSWYQPPAGSAQTMPGPLIRNFTPDNYRAANQNWSSTTDGEGRMYFGNGQGLLEFDGLSWTLHPLPVAEVLRSTAYCQATEKLYTGAYGEFGYWQRQDNGRLLYHSISQGRLQGDEQREEIWHILPTVDGVYFQSFSMLLLWRNDSLKRIDLPGNVMFLQQVRERLYLPVIGQGIYELRDACCFTLVPGSDLFQDKTISCILPHPEGFLVGTEKSGIYLYRDGRFLPWDTEMDRMARQYQLNKAQLAGDDRYVFGTILSGLFLSDASGRVRQHLNQESGLQNNTVLSIADDRQGNIWLGLDRGVDLIGLSQPMRYYRSADGRIGSVYDAATLEGRLYLATNRGVFFRSWPLLEMERFQLIEETRGQSWSLHVSRGSLLCGHNEGTFRIEGIRAEKISSVTGGWSFAQVDGSNAALLQGSYTGLVRFNWSSDSSQWVFAGRIYGSNCSVKAIYPAHEGWYWMECQHEGISRIRIDLEAAQISDHIHYGPDRGLPRHPRTYLTPRGDSMLVQVDEQLYYYDRASDSFQLLPQNDAQDLPIQRYLHLPGAVQIEVFPDFIKYHNATGTRIFTGRMIPQSEQVCRLQGSTLLFCLDDGFALLNGELQFGGDTRGPRVKSYRFSGKNCTPQSRPTDADLSVPISCNSVTFDFSLDQYTQPGLLRYRLKPLQDTWSTWDDYAQKSFLDLRAGAYTLELQSQLSPQLSTFSFDIRPPWYQRSYMAIPYLALIGGLVYLLNQFHLRRLQQQQRRLLVEKERQLQRERIENCNQQLQRDVIIKSKELANSTFNLIRKNELLIQIRDQLDQMRQSKDPQQQKKYYGKMMRLINRQLSHQDDWEVFEQNFNQVHDAFFKKLLQRFPDLTPGDLKLAACLKMNLSSKEISPLLNISIRGVENKRYRLRKKLNLPADENLAEFMMNL